MTEGQWPLAASPIVGSDYTVTEKEAAFADVKSDDNIDTNPHVLPGPVCFRGCCFHPVAKMLLVCDPVACCLRRFEAVILSDAKIQLTPRGQIGERGNTGGKFLNPVAVDVNNRGEIAVADAKLNRVQFFTGSGSALHYFGKSGTSRGEFRGICDLKFTALGHVAVIDSDNHRIQVMTTTGGVVLVVGHQGIRRGELNSPCALDIAHNGDFFVCDAGNKRIQRFSAKGKWLAAWGSTRVAVSTTPSTPQYDTHGLFPITAPQLKSVFDNPSDVMVGVNGEVLVCDTGRQRVIVFSESGSCLHVLSMLKAPQWTPVAMCLLRNALVVVVRRNNGHQQTENTPHRLVVHPPAKTIGAGRFRPWPWATLLHTISYLTYADTMSIRLVSRTFHRGCRILRNEWQLFPLIPGHATGSKYGHVVTKATGRIAVVEAFATWGLRIFKPTSRIRKHVMDFESGFQSAICGLFGPMFFHDHEPILRALFRFHSLSHDKMEINQAGFLEIVTEIEEVCAGFLQWHQCPALRQCDPMPCIRLPQAQSERADAMPTHVDKLRHVEDAHSAKLNRLLTKLQTV